MISSEDIALAMQCLETHYANGPQISPRVPEEMRCDPTDLDGWIKWKLVRSKLQESDVIELERQLPYKLPPFYRAFLVSYYVLDLDFGEFILPALPSDDPLKHLKRYLYHRDLWDIGFGTFGSNPYGDPLCFDLHSPTVEGDFPIIIINHDMLSPTLWKNRDSVVPHAKKVADSFRTFFTTRCMLK